MHRNDHMRRISIILLSVLLAAACSGEDSGSAIGQACVLDSDCGPDLYCGDESRCYPIGAYESCAQDGDCPTGWYCGVRDECIPDGYATACQYDTDCISGFFCADSERCLPIPELDPVACEESTSCPGDRDTCSETGYCVDDDTALGAPCTSANDCPAGYECTLGSGGGQANGYCTLPCYPFAPFETCPRGAVCLDFDERQVCGVLCDEVAGCAGAALECVLRAGYRVCWRDGA